jgi:hypothetical protein
MLKRHLHSRVFYSTIHSKICDQLKYPSTDEWIKKMWYAPNGIALNHKILSFSATWMELEDMMLSKISQAQKNKYSMFLLICGSQEVDCIEVENRIRVTRSWEECGRRKDRENRSWVQGAVGLEVTSNVSMQYDNS